METGGLAVVKLGWMWFDNDPKTSLENKLERASARFRQKFGVTPRLCYVNRDTLAESQQTWGRLQVKPASNVLPGHFLFEVQEMAPPA